MNKSDIVIHNFIDHNNMLIVSKHYHDNLSDKVKKCTKLLVEAVDIIEKHHIIKFIPSIIFKFGVLPKNGNISLLGQYTDYGKANFLELDIKRLRGRTLFLQCLCHELVHSEQKRLGKTEFKGLTPYWKGKKYDLVDQLESIENHEKYQEYPWEKEAYRRQGELACEVMGLLKQAK
jgi:hypothetical protein